MFSITSNRNLKIELIFFDVSCIMYTELWEYEICEYLNYLQKSCLFLANKLFSFNLHRFEYEIIIGTETVNDMIITLDNLIFYKNPTKELSTYVKNRKDVFLEAIRRNRKYMVFILLGDRTLMRHLSDITLALNEIENTDYPCVQCLLKEYGLQIENYSRKCNIYWNCKPCARDIYSYGFINFFDDENKNRLLGLCFGSYLTRI